MHQALIFLVFCLLGNYANNQLLLYVCAETHTCSILRQIVHGKHDIKNMSVIDPRNYQKTIRIFIKIDDPKPQNPPPKIMFSSLLYHNISNTQISELLKNIWFLYCFRRPVSIRRARGGSLERSLELPECSRSATLSRPCSDPGSNWSPKRSWGVISPLWGMMFHPWGRMVHPWRLTFHLWNVIFHPPGVTRPQGLARRFARSD